MNHYLAMIRWERITTWLLCIQLYENMMMLRKEKSMKKALVFGGGGSKGAYEIGVWKALDQLHIYFDIVTGTSIGAINGVMYVQKDYERAFKLWSNLAVDDVIRHGINVDTDIELLLSQKAKYHDFFQSVFHNRGTDITPFVNMVRKYFDKEKFFSSSIEYGCMTYNFTKRQPYPVLKNALLKDDAFNYLIASASCFPAFPMKSIKGEKFIDGGFYDNVPIELARSMGATYIVAIDLKAVGKNLIHTKQKNLIYIEPHVPLGSFLLFDKDLIDRNITLGYQDTMKKFGIYKGSIYTFQLFDEKMILLFEERMQEGMSHIDRLIDRKHMNDILEQIVNHRFTASLSKYQAYEWSYLSILEMIAYDFHLNDIGVWDFSDFVNKVKQTTDEHQMVMECMNKDMKNIIHTVLHMQQTSKEAIILIYHILLHVNELQRMELFLAALMNHSFMKAYMLYVIAKDNIIEDIWRG